MRSYRNVIHPLHRSTHYVTQSIRLPKNFVLIIHMQAAIMTSISKTFLCHITTHVQRLSRGRRSSARAEAVLGTARHGLQVAHATRASSLPADSLLTPLVVPRLGRWVATGSTSYHVLVCTHFKQTTYSCADGGRNDGCSDGTACASLC